MALPQGTNATNVNTTNWNALVDAIDINTAITGALSSELQSLTDAEVQQLQNIGTVTITLTQWGYLGGSDQAVKTSDSPRFAVLSVNNSGIHILDTDASHDLILAVGSNLAADRILTLTTGDAARTLTISGDATIADWFDQAVKAASSPRFAVLSVNNSGIHILDTDASHDLILAVGSNLSADKTLTLTTGDSDRTLTISGNATIADWFDQAVKAASSPTFAGVTLNNSGLHILDTNASHDLILKPESDLTADRTLSITTGDQNRAVVLANYAGMFITGNGTATTILLVDAYEPITIWGSDMPEVISSADNSSNDITIGETGDYLAGFTIAASSAGTNKFYVFMTFEIAASGSTITGATQATPCVITAVGHGFSNGDTVKISGVNGMTALNDQIYTVTNKADDTFELEDDNGADIASGGYGAYSGPSGTAYLATKHRAVCAERKFAAGGDVGSVSGNGIATFTSGNTLELHVKGTSDASDITVLSAQFWMHKL